MNKYYIVEGIDHIIYKALFIQKGDIPSGDLYQIVDIHGNKTLNSAKYLFKHELLNTLKEAEQKRDEIIKFLKSQESTSRGISGHFGTRPPARCLWNTNHR